MPCAMSALLSALLIALPTVAPPVDPTSSGKAVACVTTPFPAPTIDGRLDEALWRDGLPIGGFVQDEPNEGAPVSERTEVVVATDATALYVGARLFDSSSGLVHALLARRDDDVSSDQFL